jgi:hypothetical protein
MNASAMMASLDFAVSLMHLALIFKSTFEHHPSQQTLELFLTILTFLYMLKTILLKYMASLTSFSFKVGDGYSQIQIY